MKVSVLIPVYNQEKYIIRALDSIPARDDIEIVVYDDGSTDRTWSRVIDYEHDNYPSKIIRTACNSFNQGVAVAMNHLYDFASGDYVVALGSDDYFTPDFEKAMAELDGTDLVYFNLVTNDGTVFDVNPKTKLKYCGSTKFILRDFLGDTRCPLLEAGEDLVFYKELLKKNPKEKFTGIVAKHYNFPREGSLSWRLREGLITNKEKNNG